jgi:hypothetical protein
MKFGFFNKSSYPVNHDLDYGIKGSSVGLRGIGAPAVLLSTAETDKVFADEFDRMVAQPLLADLGIESNISQPNPEDLD